ncbi:hypothetical protein [Nonomuraea basaltis]|uniref:hypothetical protein n=1 Tax=Nonomuraea basaltis TaxID=2495887 RepID=UPI00110C63AF|nr:hypothetical protein [Nonomuraea basaltis]TMR97587.1 hypothetical protein EJK15_16990 [Nonomuraea basaltis]
MTPGPFGGGVEVTGAGSAAGEQGPAETQERREVPADMVAAQARLAEAQARLVEALVAGGDVPEGFDQERVRAQAASLVAKRRSIVARIRPDTAIAAGSRLASEFAAYARSRGAPPPSYRTDADDFAAWLRERGRMPDRPAAKSPWWSRLLPSRAVRR